MELNNNILLAAGAAALGFVVLRNRKPGSTAPNTGLPGGGFRISGDGYNAGSNSGGGQSGNVHPGNGGGQSSPAPSGGTQVLVMFMREGLAPGCTGGQSPPHPVDVRLNGTSYPLSSESNWNSLMDGNASLGKGKIINLPGPLTSFGFTAGQAKKSGLNMWGYGWWKYKIINLRPDFNLARPSMSSGRDFWGSAYSTGGLVGPGGWNAHTGDFFPDFHRQIDGPNFNGYLNVAEMNKTGKIGIYLYGYGVNNPHFTQNNQYAPKNC